MCGAAISTQTSSTQRHSSWGRGSPSSTSCTWRSSTPGTVQYSTVQNKAQYSTEQSIVRCGTVQYSTARHQGPGAARRLLHQPHHTRLLQLRLPGARGGGGGGAAGGGRGGEEAGAGGGGRPGAELQLAGRGEAHHHQRGRGARGHSVFCNDL